MLCLARGVLSATYALLYVSDLVVYDGVFYQCPKRGVLCATYVMFHVSDLVAYDVVFRQCVKSFHVMR